MKTDKNKFIIDVVPLTRIPMVRNQSFSYLWEEKLPVGTLVSVSLFRRNVEGVVIGSRDDFHRLGNIELKKIDKVIEEEFLDKKQLELAKFISKYYIAPLGIVMKGFSPKRAKARNSKFVISNLDNKKNITLTKNQQDAVKQITSYKLPITSYLLYGPSGSGKTEVYIHSILEMRKKNPDFQFLILLPELTLSPQAIERYGEYFPPEEIAVINSNISAGQFYQNWLRIKSGEAKIIIATRKGAFSPYKKLGLIVIDEEQDMSFKQWDMNPRYDARKLAEKLAEIHGCKIVRGTATPSVDTYFRTVNKEIRLLELPVLNLEVESSKYKVLSKKKEMLSTAYLLLSTCVVDMRKERLDKNLSCISKKLKSEISYALRNNLQAVLFINRQGMSNFSVCESCKTVLACPKCDRALIYDKEGNYRCVHCSYKTSIMPQCSKCKGIIFKNVGLGTQKVEKEISNLFPGAKIARIDSQAISEKGYQEKIYKDFSEKKIDILIGTQMIAKGWDFPNLSLVGIVDADNMLSLPDFYASEKAFQTILQVSGRAGRPGAKYPGVVVVQTYQPDNKLWKWIAEKDWKAFYEYETAERKVLSLPPFGKIVKLVFQDFSREKVEKEAVRVYNSLKEAKNAMISEPQDAYVPKIRGRFRKQIIIKYKNDLPENIVSILKQLPNGWIVDVDPISII